MDDDQHKKSEKCTVLALWQYRRMRGTSIFSSCTVTPFVVLQGLFIFPEGFTLIDVYQFERTNIDALNTLQVAWRLKALYFEH